MNKTMSINNPSMEYSTSKLDKKILKIKEEIGGIYIYSMNVFKGWLGI